MRTAKLGFVFQSFNLLGRTSAINNVAMPLDYSLSPPPVAKAIERASELLNESRSRSSARSLVVADVGRAAATRGNCPLADQSAVAAAGR